MAVIRGAKQAVLIDPNGVLFTVHNEWGWGLPELVAPHLSAGDSSSAAAKAEVAGLLGAVRVLGPDPRLRVSRVVMDRDGELEVFLESGERVRLGTPDRLPAKVKLLGMALDQLGVERIDLLDLRDPSAAYWKERGKGQGGLLKK